MKSRLEKVQDLVLFRYGHTGVQETLQTVVKVLGLIPVYPVRNVNNFSSTTYEYVNLVAMASFETVCLLGRILL
jgi:ribosome-binding ATPase YchF (GTP1/OBG family)